MDNYLSIIKPQQSKLFYGYVIAVVGTLGIWASLPGQTVGVSTFTDPVKDALGLNRDQFSNAYMIGTILSSVFLSKAGLWFDKYGARWVSLGAVLVLAISLILFSQSQIISNSIQAITGTESAMIPFFLIVLLFFLIRFSGQGVLTMASRNMIMKWFDNHRGKVNAFSSIAVSLGFSSAPIWIDALIEDKGWQGAWLFMAGGLFLFAIIILQFYRDNPEEHGLIPDGKTLAKKEKVQITSRIQFSVKEAIATRAFWMYALTISFYSFFVTGLTFHVVSIFETGGYNKSEAIAIFLPTSVITVIISTLANYLSDSIKLKLYLYLMIVGGFIATAGLILISSDAGIPFLIIGVGILGGFFAVLNTITWPRFFGTKNLGAITGKIMGLIVFSSALAPSLYSLSITYLKSYTYIGYLSLFFLIFVSIGSIRANNPQ